MIYVSGSCARCGTYYELPRQEAEASVYMQISNDGPPLMEILCNNSQLCAKRSRPC